MWGSITIFVAVLSNFTLCTPIDALHFIPFSLLPQTSFSQVTRPGLSRKDISDIREAFDLFDADGSGAISVDELYSAMESLGVESKGTIQQVFTRFDKNRSGDIDFEEFVDMMTASNVSVEDRGACKDVFDLFDHDRTGHVTLENLKRVAETIGANMSDLELMNIMKRVNTEGTGEITFDEFFAVVAGQRDGT